MLLGTPVSMRPERWRMARSAVAGRLVNGFSRRDWILGLVYRGSKGAPLGPAGPYSLHPCPDLGAVVRVVVEGIRTLATKGSNGAPPGLTFSTSSWLMASDACDYGQ